ncbi:MAG: T9SS type A sorting domain-containing protein [Bacteroidales bacterium]|nr:T9SS type A sorting domain-containing protein [Bacteroidales bacterium]
MIKRSILAFVLCIGIYIGLNAQNVVVVENNDNTTQTFALGEQGEMLFTENNDSLVVRISENDYTSFLLSEISKIYFVQVSSVSEIDVQNTMFVYPNPARDFIKIANNSQENQILSIYSIDGRMLVKQNYSANEGIDISSLKEGLYIVKLNGQTFKFSKL